jgi:hypothetical protein
MDWPLILSLVIGVISLALTVIGVIQQGRHSARYANKKAIVYDAAMAWPIASALPDDRSDRVTITYSPPCGDPITVKSLYVSFVRVLSLGDIPVKWEDVPRTDPPKVEVTGVSLLDISVVATTRSPIAFQCGRLAWVRRGQPAVSRLSSLSATMAP